MSIDLNADVGEGMDDAALMPFITSANVACGGHAGDEVSIRHVTGLARAHGVAVGAHPSYPDRERFGREPLDLSPDALQRTLSQQLALAARAGGPLVHVKPHGALYHRANESRDVARAIAAAVKAFDPRLVVVGFAGSLLLDVAREHGLAAAGEAFVDRRYRDGRLVPRREPDALLTDPSEAADQAVRLALEGNAQTLCLHSDTPGAAGIAAETRRRLVAAGVTVRALTADRA